MSTSPLPTVSPIGLYLITALTARTGTCLQFFVELSPEQERNHGGVEGAAVQGHIEMRLDGHEHPQWIGAIPVTTEVERRELVECWERLDAHEIESIREARLGR